MALLTKVTDAFVEDKSVLENCFYQYHLADINTLTLITTFLRHFN